MSPIPQQPEILTTTVGSYPAPGWFVTHPGEQTRLDATRVVFDTQRQAGIDLPTEGEIYRLDPSHPETNGMIEYFVSRLGGMRTSLGREDIERFRADQAMKFRGKPAAVVEGPVDEGVLNLAVDCERAASVAGGAFKFTLTSPYMLARSVLDRYYSDREKLVHAIADALAKQVPDLPCSCVQVDEANVPGHPEAAPLAQGAIAKVLAPFPGEKAVHLCFGNYGGQVIQSGRWGQLVDFLNGLGCDHLVLELAHRPEDDLTALKDVDPRIGLGLGVIDIKALPVESADTVAARIENAQRALGPERVKFVHPDCGFWMLHRSVADRKIAALAAGRDLQLGRSAA